MVVYLDLEKMRQAGLGSELSVHDLSHVWDWDSYFQGNSMDMTEKFEKDFLKAKIYAGKDKEVLICWRGELPLELFDVHDAATKQKKSSLQDYLTEFFPPSFGSSTRHQPLRRSRSEMPRRPPPMPPPAGPPPPWRAAEWDPPTKRLW